MPTELWNYELGTIEHVIETARVLGFTAAHFVDSYETFRGFGTNELTDLAWLKAKEAHDFFLAALIAYDGGVRDAD